MKECPECLSKVDDSSSQCHICGKRLIPASQLEKIDSKTTTWQKLMIIAGAIVLVAIAFTFLGAGKREQQAAQKIFEPSVTQIILEAADQTGVAHAFGTPTHMLSAGTKAADIRVNFPTGPMHESQAKRFGEKVCELIARIYVKKGYIPRALSVTVSSAVPGKRSFIYGTAYYDGDKDKLFWLGAEK